MNTVLYEAERLCYRCAPHELRGAHLYLVAKSDVPAELGGTSTVLTAWTSGTLDLQLREQIGAKWKGRGPCAVIDTTRDRAAVLGDALHELAHRLEASRLFDPAPRFVSITEAAHATAEELATAQPIARQLATHSATWVRLALHLAHRAQLDAIPEPPGAELVGYDFVRRVVLTMRTILWDECVRWECRPLAELKATPAPRDFCDLYQYAVQCADLEPVGAA